METFKLIAAFLVGVFAAFIGSMVGSGGLISIPFLIFLGLPPQIAIATNRIGAVGLQIGALVRFLKSNEIDWRYVVRFGLLSLAGAQIGARLLLQADDAILRHIIVGFMLAMLPLLFFMKNLGIENKEVSAGRKAVGYVLLLLTYTWQAFFGGGAATIIFYVMMLFFGMSINRSSATNKIPGLLLSVSTLIVFVSHGIVNWVYGIDLFFGMLAGGYLGAHTALKKGDAWVKAVFVVVVVVSAVKLVLG